MVRREEAAKKMLQNQINHMTQCVCVRDLTECIILSIVYVSMIQVNMRFFINFFKGPSEMYIRLHLQQPSKV